MNKPAKEPEAIMRAVMKTAQINTDVLNTLKLHLGMALTSDESEDRSLALQIRIAESMRNSQLC